MAENRKEALIFENISKSFGSVKANDNVCLEVYEGEILSLLGENGSGKTTLMNMCIGIYHQDEGSIKVHGKPAVINNPHDAASYGIGMVHQHFKLVDIFSACENIVLGLNDGKYDLKSAKKRIAEICERYGFELDPDKKIYEMSVSEKQTVEIVKVLFRDVDILILDEPTAVLTPQESDKLFAVLRRMKQDGRSVIIITHKLNEVLSISDRVAVMRKGCHIGTVNTSETNTKQLTELMVGEKVSLDINRSIPKNSVDKVILKNVSMTDNDGIKVLDNVTFSAKSGEILGIAGIAGSGQRELLETIAGLLPIQSGNVDYIDSEKGKISLIGKNPLEVRKLGIRLSFVPEDRLGMGLIGNMDMTDNMMLRSYTYGRSVFVDRTPPKKLAERLIASLKIKTPGVSTPIRRLSGGNVQKVLVGREIAAAPTVLMAAYPSRGLDITSSYLIYDLMNEQKESGVAVIFVGEDLDVMLSLCDRIIVLCGGRITGEVDARTATKEEIGVLMTKGKAV